MDRQLVFIYICLIVINLAFYFKSLSICIKTRLFFQIFRSNQKVFPAIPKISQTSIHTAHVKSYFLNSLWKLLLEMSRPASRTTSFLLSASFTAFRLPLAFFQLIRYSFTFSSSQKHILCESDPAFALHPNSNLYSTHQIRGVTSSPNFETLNDLSYRQAVPNPT